MHRADRVDTGSTGTTAGCAVADGADHRAGSSTRGERPGGVVHQNDLGVVADRGQRRGDGCRPVGAADDHGRPVAQQSVGQRPV